MVPSTHFLEFGQNGLKMCLEEELQIEFSRVQSEWNGDTRHWDAAGITLAHQKKIP
jgi:hypothetical protein